MKRFFVLILLALTACSSFHGVDKAADDGGSKGDPDPANALDAGAPGEEDAGSQKDVDAASSATCDGGQTACGAVCTDLMTDDQNCGACGRVCNFAGCASGECEHAVFVTSAMYNGSMGGLAGADSHCNDLAQAAGLHGPFLAWLSTASASPSTRFLQATRPYRLAKTGTQIATNYASLIGGTIDSPIRSNESGVVVPDTRVWSGTSPYGKFYMACGTSDWVSTSPYSGSVGSSSTTAAAWSDVDVNSCTEYRPIYCFEQ